MPKAAKGATTLAGLGYEWQKSTAAMRLAAVGTPCPKCRVVMTSGSRSKRAVTVDHITPRALGGTNDLWNLRIRCRSCNSRSGAVIGNRSPKRRPGRRRPFMPAPFSVSRKW